VFAEVQFVSCCNVLIHFDRPLQERALALFRDALCPGGLLRIGTRETLRLSGHEAAFDALQPPLRTYRKREAA
jgi:chemotaxis protein methyltransferase CheR